MSRTALYQDVTSTLLDRCQVPPAATIADVGCGSGLATKGLLERYGATVEAIVGVDPSELELAIAKRRVVHPKVRFHLGRAQDLRGFVGEVDATVLSNVLHLIPAEEREAALAGCYEVLKPGGRCVFNSLYYEGAVLPETQPFYGRWMLETNIWLRARKRSVAFPKKPPVALRLFTPAEHAAMLERIGFSNIAVDEQRYDWSADDWKALSKYSVFVEGATGLTDIALGSEALIAGIDATFSALKITSVARNFLYGSGSK